MPEIKLSVVIVTYKSFPVIRDCLNSIYKYNDIGDALEVIVVDNSPPEDPMLKILEREYPKVSLIKNLTNGGFGQGNNLGVKEAKGEYLLFLNPDTILVESVFDFAVEKFSRDHRLATIGLQMVSPSLKAQDSFFYRNEYFGFYEYMSIKFLNKLNLFNPKTMFTTGACLFIRRDVFFDAGMFDENIFLYCEEPDLFRRVDLLKLNYNFGFFPEKKVIHLEGCSGEYNPRAHEEYYRSAIYYLQKYGFDVLGYLNFILKYSNFKRSVFRALLSSQGVQVMEDHLETLAKLKAKYTNKPTL